MARAAREIAAAFETAGAPLDAVAALCPPLPTLHLYAQPPDEDYLDAQRAFAAQHPWFQVVRLNAASHFPMFEAPDVIAELLHDFVAREPPRSRWSDYGKRPPWPDDEARIGDLRAGERAPWVSQNMRACSTAGSTYRRI